MPENTYAQRLEIVEIYKRLKVDGNLGTLPQTLGDRGFSNISLQTVRRYVREEDAIRQALANDSSQSSRCRPPKPALPEVEKALSEWIRAAERRGLRLTGSLIQEKAFSIARELGVPDSDLHTFSDGWLTRFKSRFGLKQHVFHGEAASAPIETIVDETEKLREVLARYPLHNRFNFDETALNYRSGPQRGIASQPMPGIKLDKTRLTYVLCTSAAGEKLPPFVIGHSTQPRCFKHGPPSSYGFQYDSNKKAWMTLVICTGYLAWINSIMQAQDRHILLLCDNASSHKVDSNLFSHIEILYLPPNLTAWLQPMDAGIIRAFKAKYKSLFARYALDLDAMGAENPYRIDQLEAMRLAHRAWESVSGDTIRNCWRHTGILPPTDIARLEGMFGRTRL